MSNDKPKSQTTNLDSWNNRLDENLEKTTAGNPEADEKAEDFNQEFGSDAKRKSPALNDDDLTDNMRANQPRPAQDTPGEINREE